MTRSLRRSRGPWNHNIHYHRVVLAALPYGCERALDVGWGEAAMTFGETRRLARRILPGVRYRRHLLWRYSIVWTRPAE